MNKNTRKVMHSSNRQDWRTPKEFFKSLDALYHFDLDGAATKDNALCSAYFSPENSAFGKAPVVGWTIWLNPPYGRQITEKFVRQAARWCETGCTVVLLLPARTDTKMWHEVVEKGVEEAWAAYKFVKGRLKFDDGKDPAPFPSVVVVFSNRTEQLDKLFDWRQP